MGRVATFALLGSAIAGISAMGIPSFASAASEPETAAHQPASYSQHPQRADRRFLKESRVRRLLEAHNRERARLRLPALRWNRNLEREAADWGKVLSRKGRLEHASHRVRNGTGENLWMGTAGVWDVETMVAGFIDERRHYRHGNFPNISRTGNWADVGHYTQVIWRDPTEVGCAVVTERACDVLVCRYWPAGNVWGRRAY